jgi:hypothetical protein
MLEKVMVVNNMPTPNGIMIQPHASSSAYIRFRIGKKYSYFKSVVALNDGSTSSSPVKFVVVGDNKILWESKNVQKSGDLSECTTKVLDVELLELHVICTGFNAGALAVWVEPYLLK